MFFFGFIITSSKGGMSIGSYEVVGRLASSGLEWGLEYLQDFGPLKEGSEG